MTTHPSCNRHMRNGITPVVPVRAAGVTVAMGMDDKTINEKTWVMQVTFNYDAAAIGEDRQILFPVERDGQRMAQLARRSFDAVFAQRGNVHMFDKQRNGVTCAKSGAEIRPPIGVGADAVMNVQCGKRP